MSDLKNGNPAFGPNWVLLEGVNVIEYYTKQQIIWCKKNKKVNKLHKNIVYPKMVAKKNTKVAQKGLRLHVHDSKKADM